MLATAAPVDPAPPVPVAVPEPERIAPDPVVTMLPDAPLAIDDVGLISTVVLLLALTTTVRVLLNMEPVPGRTSVWTPGPTAGMLAGSGWLVTTAGCPGMLEAAAGCWGMLVMTAGWPVTTPREFVNWRSVVWG